MKGKNILLLVVLIGCVGYGVAQSHVALYSLLPPYDQTAISLSSFLEGIPQTQEGRALIQSLIQVIEAQTNVKLPPYVVDELLSDATQILNYTVLSNPTLSGLWYSANVAYWTGSIPQVNTSFPKVPAAPFNFPSDTLTAPIDLSFFVPTLTYVGDNIFTGYAFPNTTSMTQARINSVMSLLFNQLADNIHLSPQDPSYSYVTYNNVKYDNVEDFLMALFKASWEIDVYLEWHVAQFYGLYTNFTGTLLSVADPLMVLTGITNSTGQQAIMPATHSQWMISVKSNNFSFALEWYQGDTSYGFFPGDMYQITPWAGRATSPISLAQLAAVEAIKKMTFVQDVFVRAAEHANLYDAGYGLTGVCDDSCAIVEIMAGMKTELYPFFIESKWVVPEINKRISKMDANYKLYQSMLSAVNGLPLDWVGVNPSAAARANATIVWPSGKYPWQCVYDSQLIFKQNMTGNKPM